MIKTRLFALIALIIGIAAGAYVFTTEMKGSDPFKLGLDLQGGSYLVYRADVSEVPEDEVTSSMDALRDVIEKRINAFGIAEPKVSTETHTLGVEGTEERLVVELPGITDIDEAIEMIGQTPLLEFKTEADEATVIAINEEIDALLESITADNPEAVLDESTLAQITALQKEVYVTTELTGKYLERSQLQFTQAGVQGGGGLQSQPYIGLNFDSEGAELFADITRENIGKTLAIFLDGEIISAPRVNAEITGGQAIIEGNFEIEEAKTLVGRLNSGALPIPLVGPIDTTTIGPSLGQDAVNAGVYSGIIGLILVSIILILWYRLPGLIAVVALGVYTAVMLYLFKFIPVTLTSAGIAGFIISIGIAVDANILIFERMKEEIRNGKNLYASVETGFKRAWASIRDANISSIISAVVLFWQGTALIKGFALTFGLGILVSMITAITVTRLLLLSLTQKESKSNKTIRFLYGNGFSK